MKEKEKLSNEEIVEIIKQGCGDAEYMALLYKKNTALIRKIVVPYSAFESLEDLMQEAYFGLWEAVNHYDSSKEVLFMSYASYWIRQAAMSYVEKSSLICVPRHVQNLIREYKKTVERFLQQYYQEPTDIEIAKEMGISIRDLEEIKKSILNYESLDKPFEADGELTLSDCIASEEDIESETTDRMFQKYQKNILWHLAKEKLDFEDWKIIVLYFKRNMSLIEIANRENMSYQKVRNIKDNAVRRLRLRAGREYMTKLGTTDFFHNGLERFKISGSSNVENMAIRNTEIEEKYEKIGKRLSGLAYCTH